MPGCGFLLWPTNVTLPDGSNYGYHVGGKGGIGIDVVAEFAKEMTKAGLPHSYYYSLKDSFLLNARHDNVQNPSGLLPGQINVTQEQFEDISVAAVVGKSSVHVCLLSGENVPHPIEHPCPDRTMESIWRPRRDLVRWWHLVAHQGISHSLRFAPRCIVPASCSRDTRTGLCLSCKSCSPTPSPWVRCVCVCVCVRVCVIQSIVLS